MRFRRHRFPAIIPSAAHDTELFPQFIAADSVFGEVVGTCLRPPVSDCAFSTIILLLALCLKIYPYWIV
ncbi:hypothetical protein DR91_2074 [Neisseria lactamica ATCC 23970]|nr:hypothetical protein DR91_2074 [Neisseria lactamica ATCC 23970]